MFGGDTSGSTWKQARYDWLGGNIYLEDWSAYSSGTARAYYVDIPLTNGGYQNYTVSWIGWKAGFTSAPYVQAYILDSGGGTVATSSAPALDNFYSGVRSSVTVGSSGGTGVTLRLYVVIPAQTVGAYCAAMISQIKLEVGSSMTAFTDDTSVNSLNVGLVAANANIATNASALATESASRAAADTTLTANLGTVTAQASTSAAAIVDIEGGTAWIESVVSAGGGDLGAARMRAGKAGSFLDLIFTVIRLANVSNGSVLEVMRAVDGFAYFSNPVSIDVGGQRLTLGPGFGVSSDLLFWFGPGTTDIDEMTKTNGHWAWATDGETYRGASTLTTPTVDDQTKTGTAAFDNVTTSGTTLHTMATIDLTVGASGYIELISPLFSGPLSLSQETGMTLSSGTDWFGNMIVTEQLQSGGTEHTLWTIPLQISDTGGGLFDFIFDPPPNPLVAQNVSGASRYRIKLQRTSGSNNVSGNGLQGKFTIRRTP